MNQKVNDESETRGLAAISYVWILFLVPILLKTKSDYVMYHVRQGLVFFILSTICSFIIWIPIFGWFLGIFIFILFIIGLLNALTGKKEPLPLIGKYAEKINI